MARALILTFAALLAGSIPAGAQPRPYETTEPPLADDPHADEMIRQAGGQFPARQANPPGNSYATPVVIVTVYAPQFVQAGKDFTFKLHVENISNMTAADVQVIYRLPKGGTLKKAEPEPTKRSDGAGLTAFPAPDITRVSNKQRTSPPDEKTQVQSAPNPPDGAQQFPDQLRPVAAPPATDKREQSPRPAKTSDVQQAGHTEARPAGEILIWSIGKLTAGEKKDIELTVAPGPDMAEWTHIVSVRFEHGRQAKTRIAKPALTVKIFAPMAQQFETVPVRFEVRNPGLVEVKDIRFEVSLPGGLAHQYDLLPGQSPDPKNSPQLRSWPIPRLGPGEVRYFDERILVESDPGKPLFAKAIASNGVESPEAKTTLKLLAPKLDLDVNGPKRRGAHETAAYRLTVRNSGQTPLRNITVTDNFSPTCEVISVSDAGRTFDTSVQWIIGQLAPNESRVFELTAKAKKPGECKHQFVATTRGVKNEKPWQTLFEEIASLQMVVQPDLTAIAVGKTVRVSITVDNSGSAAANNVRAAAILPASLEFVSAEPATARNDGGRVSFEIGQLAAGGRQVLTVTAKAVRAALPAVVTAELSADQLVKGVVRRQESITISDPTRPGPQ